MIKIHSKREVMRYISYKPTTAYSCIPVLYQLFIPPGPNGGNFEIPIP